MYDELILRLRDAAKMSEALAVLLPHSEGNATAKLCKEAADAIEELQKRVPPVPHGRLIDADALREVVKKHATPSDAWVFSLIRTAPIIIPAEEGE